MRICRVTATPIYIPFRRFYGRTIQSAQGELRFTRYGLVEVEAEGGLVGWGEISTLFVPDLVNTVLAPALVGNDARDVTRAAALMGTLVERAEPAKAGVAMALLDPAGKALGVPVYRLLGGKRRDRIPLIRSISAARRAGPVAGRQLQLPPASCRWRRPPTAPARSASRRRIVACLA
jgi:L-alanine-DL-glutamate epimerase-like enolase superfamily enzyme